MTDARIEAFRKSLPPDHRLLDEVQDDLFARLVSDVSHTLLESGTGSGKTTMAIGTVAHFLSSGAMERILIAAPQNQIKDAFIQDQCPTGLKRLDDGHFDRSVDGITPTPEVQDS